MTSGGRTGAGGVSPSWSSGRRAFGLVLIVALLIALLPMLAFFRLRAAAAPELELQDLLLLTPQSAGKVEAAAKAGDIQAQSILGVAYLQGNDYEPRNVTAAVYWFHRIADRDRAEYDQVGEQMQSLLDERRLTPDPRQQHKLDLEYFDVVQKKLAFDIAFVGLIEIYSGGQGFAYANPALARRYMRQGAAYGIAPAQRMLGIAYLFGRLGVPRDAAQGLRLLHLAAAQGDQTAERLLAAWYESRVGVPRNADATAA